MASKKKYKANYSEGDCFIFPLEHGGFARGIIARHDLTCDRPIGKLLGYFFSPIYNSQSEAVISEDLKRENAIYIKLFSDLGLTEHDWKIIGKIEPWIKEDWPVPMFRTFHEITHQGELRPYDEKTLESDSAHWIKVTPSEAMKYPEDGFAGHGFVEGRISRILHNIPTSPEAISHIPATKQRILAEKRVTIYSEGDCFVFPLEEGGFARGVIARCNHAMGELLGYFFPPTFHTQSEAVISEDLKWENAVYVRLFSDMGLTKDEWKIIGKVEPWAREDWPIPVFGRVLAHTNQGELCHYDDKLQIDYTRSVKVSIAEAQKYPADSFATYGSMERIVSQILHDMFPGQRQVTPKPQATPTPPPSNRPASPRPNPIAVSLKKLLTRLDGIMEKHEEVQDTDVREQLHEAVQNAFVLETADYGLPEEFGMFTKAGNKRVRSALAAFLPKAVELATKAGLSSESLRLAAFQDIEVTSENGSTYDDYFGDSD